MHRHHKHWTRTEDRELARLHLAGNKLRVTAKALGRTAIAVKGRLLQQRIMRHVPGKTKAAIRRLHALGFNDCEIARRLDVTQTTVWHHRRDLGLPVNPRTAEAHRKALLRFIHKGGRPPGQARWELSRFRAIHEGWPAGCNERQADYLEAIRANPGCTAEQLHQCLPGVVQRNSVLRLLAQLIREGWVERYGRKPQRHRLAEAVQKARECYLMRGQEAA